MSSPAPPVRVVLRVAEAEDPARVGTEIPIGNLPATLGRSPDCDVVVEDTGVSRRHAEIRADEAGRIEVVDAGSSNGVWVGDRRVDRHELEPGTTFRVGTTTLELLPPEPPPGAHGSTRHFALLPEEEIAAVSGAGDGPTETPMAETPRAPSSEGRGRTGAAVAEPEPEEETPSEPEAPEPDEGLPPADPEAAPDQASRIFSQLAGPRSPLLELGEPVAASGNHPFLLDDPSSVWVVASGRVEIFTVGVENGQPKGARHHYLTVDPGQGFFGMDLAAYDLPSGFLAVGRTGTVLRRIPVATLRRLAAHGKLVDEIAELLDRWITELSRSLTREIVPIPTVEHNLAADQEVSLQQNQKARSAKGPLWLVLEGGDLLYVDMETLDLPEHGLFPVTPDTWVEASNPFGVHTDLRARDSRQVLPEAAMWRGLGLGGGRLGQRLDEVILAELGRSGDALVSCHRLELFHRVFGPIPREIADAGYQKIVSLAPEVV